MKNINPHLMPEMSDASLVIAIARWHQGALEEAYRRHASAVWALANRLLSDPSKAEDITQEIFLALWKHPERFDAQRGTLRTFLLTQTHSRTIDLIRSEAARTRREEGDTAVIEALVNNLERQVLDLNMAEQVKTVYEQLPEVEKNLIDLTYFRGHTYREAAIIANQPEGTVKSRIRNALRKMRDLLPSELEER